MAENDDETREPTDGGPGPVTGVAEDLGVLQVRGRDIQLDDTVQDVLGSLDKKYQRFIELAQKEIVKHSATEKIEKVTDRFSGATFPDTERILLATPSIYADLLYNALHVERVQPDDTGGVVNSVLRQLAGIRGEFHGAIVDAIFDRNDIDVKDRNPERYQRILGLIESDGLPLEPGQVQPTVLDLNRQVADVGDVPELIEYFVTSKAAEIPAVRRLTPSAKQAMIEHLRQLIGPTIDRAKMEAGDYDQYIAVAYDRVSQLGSDGRTDPIALTRAESQVVPWDFTVETFDRADEKNVDKKNILAAGALDYVYELGERCGVYKLADALVLRWATGQVDIDDKGLQNKLYRYWKLREDRISPEERGMLYRRALNKGDAKVLPRMVVNESFPGLWHKLMEATAEYIKDFQDAFRDAAVSRNPIYQATEELQYNLTDHVTGMTHMQITEMYMQLKDAFALLGAPEIVAQLSAGRRKNVWSVIERLSSEEFGVVPDVGSIRTMAVKGNEVFQWIAAFDRNAVADNDFFTFKDAAEAWIISAASQGSDLVAPSGDAKDAKDTKDDDFGDEGDDDTKTAKKTGKADDGAW